MSEHTDTRTTQEIVGQHRAAHVAAGSPPPPPMTSWPPPPPPAGRATRPWDSYMPVMVGGLAAVAIGLLLPWATMTAPFVGQINLSGLSTDDGKIIGAALVLLVGLFYAEACQPRRGVRIAAGVVLAGVVGVLIMDVISITDRLAGMENEYVSGEIGVGLYLGIAGAVVAFVMTILRGTDLHNKS